MKRIIVLSLIVSMFIFLVGCDPDSDGEGKEFDSNAPIVEIHY